MNIYIFISNRKSKIFSISVGDSPLKYKQHQTIPKQTKLVVIPNYMYQPNTIDREIKQRQKNRI